MMEHAIIIEMLRGWEETSPHVKINYEVEQEMESLVCTFC